jgi:hypothetical protein
MSYHTLEVTHPHTPLSFAIRMGDTRPWWRFLDIHDQPLYLIGNLCDTCSAFFGLVEHAHLPITPMAVSDQLRSGLHSVSQSLIATIAHILPKGNYAVNLLTITPSFLPSERRADSRATNYGWRQFVPVDTERTLYEIILPLVPQTQLSAGAIERYKTQLQTGGVPTALALSVVDVRYPSGRGFEWTLSHFLLDGHHKVMAASQLGTALRLLSFLNLSESWATHELIEATLQVRYTA